MKQCVYYYLNFVQKKQIHKHICISLENIQKYRFMLTHNGQQNRSREGFRTSGGRFALYISHLCNKQTIDVTFNLINKSPQRN